MSHLDRLVSVAREAHPSFDPSASLAAAVGKREHRARRAKTIRRVVVAASSASFLLLLLVRASAAPSPERSGFAPVPAESLGAVGTPPQIAARTLDDGGYARD